MVLDIEVPSGERLVGGSLKAYSPSPKKCLRNKEGVWMMDVTLNGGLAKSLGGTLKAFNAGCAILTVDGQSCNSPKALQNLFIQAKTTKKATPGGKIKVTLYLSKYSDLSDVDPSKIRPH